MLAPGLRRPRPLDARTIAADEPPSPYRSPWTSALGWQVTLFMGVQSTVYFTLITWLRFVIWLVVGLLIYVFYSRKHSEFAKN